MKNPFWNGKTIWRSYRLIDKIKWHISWDSLLQYHDFSLSTHKPLRWFIYYQNDSEYFILKFLGFTYIFYKTVK